MAFVVVNNKRKPDLLSSLCFQEMLEALKSLSAFFTENSLRTRRNLRGDIERRSLSINEEFVRIFKDVKEVRSV